MAKEIDKIIQSKTAPKSNNVLWDDGENLKINRNGKWENANNTETNSLSIDPVVWKYMCNPHIVEYDRTTYECNSAIPEELSDIIYQNGEFNSLVLSTVLIKIYYPLEDDEVVWKVERITSYNRLGNVIFDNSEFVYNPNTRLFAI